VYRIAAACLLAHAACAKTSPPPAPLTPITSGIVALIGLSAPVRVVRDRWGIPHIYARNADDLFMAQGFVQAEDRLFQMDLWRRASIGRLAEVMGPNFVERDTMTRRMQYRGDMHQEWSSYAPDAQAIAAAFVRGVNAWVARAHDNPPEEFLLAGWTPAFWSENDLINRTDAFLSSGDAIDEVRRSGFSDVVGDAIRLVGPPAFFVSLAAPVPGGAGTPGPAADVLTAGDTATRAVARPAQADGMLAFEEALRRLEAPSRRYAVHLQAPGWNVIGLAAPWLPGVIVGHNADVAWSSVPIEADTQDLSVERADAAGMVRETDTIRIKGRPRPEPYQRESKGDAVVIARDTVHGRVYTLRWSGLAPGGASELAAIAVDRARNADEMRSALKRWRFPARRFAFATVSGGIEYENAAAGLIAGASSGPTAANDRPQSERAVFVHPLAIDAASRRRYDVGPISRPRDASPVGALFDRRDWDHSQVMAAPGQSGWAESAHYRDLADAWAKGEMAPLPFSDDAVRSDAAETLTLVPAVRRQ
jgi:penicillin amidase